MIPFSVFVTNRFPKGLAFRPYPFQVHLFSFISRRWRSSPTSPGSTEPTPNLDVIRPRQRLNTLIETSSEDFQNNNPPLTSQTRST
jgi:hypothetical protein